MKRFFLIGALFALTSTLSAGVARNETLQSLLAAVQAQAAVKAFTLTKLTPVNVLTASVVIAPANANRRGFIVFNNSANSGYISLAATSIAAECTRLIATFTSWEVMTPIAYTGPISAIRNAGSGTMTVWEFQ